MIIRRSALQPFDFNGLHVIDYTSGCDTGSSLAVINVPPYGRHRQAWSKRSDKYYYVLAGTIQFTVNGEEHELTAGDFCLIAQGQRFSYENRASETAVLLLVHTPNFDLEAEVFIEEA